MVKIINQLPKIDFTEHLRQGFSVNLSATETEKKALTITTQSDAKNALPLASPELIERIKEAVRGMDMTSVTTEELSKIGGMLHQSGIIDSEVVGAFISGIGEFDDSGRQINRDVKFNAIDVFDKNYQATKAIAGSNEGTKHAASVLLRANHVLNALGFFARSTNFEISLNIEA